MKNALIWSPDVLVEMVKPRKVRNQPTFTDHFSKNGGTVNDDLRISTKRILGSNKSQFDFKDYSPNNVSVEVIKGDR